MPEHPAELPAEAEGGGGGTFRPPLGGGIGGPNELPAPDWARISVSQLVNEIFRLRNRIHTLENNILAVKISAAGRNFFGVDPRPEMPLPEGEGGGGGGIPFPPEIHEIHEINELPVSRFVAALSNLVARFNQFEKQVSQQFAEITKRLDAIKK